MQLVKQEAGSAVETALEAVRLDPCRESRRRCLMKAYASSGNRSEAVAAYHEFRDLLSGEMGTEPESETQALYLEMLD